MVIFNFINHNYRLSNFFIGGDFKFNFKFKFIIIAALIACLGLAAGCINSKTNQAGEFIPNPAVRFEPVFNAKIINKYGDISETALCEIVLSKTGDMLKPFKRFRLDKNTGFSLTGFSAGDEFYIGAFIDTDGSLTPTYGREPLGGAYADIALGMCYPPEVNFIEKDNISRYKVVIKKDIETDIEIKILRPIKGRKPVNGELGLTTKPRFAWEAPAAGISAYKISVYNEETASAYWQAVSHSNEITYSVLNNNNDYNLIPAKILPANARHKWSLIGYDANNEEWAYGTGFLFLP
jgi:hypothetical protein